MAWYDPRTWFENENVSSEADPNKLYCANPQCQGEITDPEIAYSKKYGEVYHVGDCPMLANSHRALRTGEMVFSNIDYIDRERALNLHGEGKLNQLGGLEEEIESN